MQDNFLIKGGFSLSGEVEITGHKNAAGAVLSAVLLSEKAVIIDNLPLISDILNQLKIMEEIGAKIEWLEKRKIKIDPSVINPEKIPPDLFEKMRVSVLLVGPLLARFKKIKIPHPGGDKIGLRPISTHLEALEKFGVKIEEKEGFYFLEAPVKMEGKKVVLKEFSPTATENLMMFASMCSGKTIIETAAAEPSVQDLGEFLKKIGVQIEGIGTHTITISGPAQFREAEFKLCPDTLEAGTYIIAFAGTKGEGIVKNIKPGHLTMFLEKLREIGVNFEIGESDILIKPSSVFKNAKIQALPHPGFPTDLQPQLSVLLTQAEGKSLIHEPLYENRFQHLQQLRKMGADIEIVDPHRALVFGPTKLMSTKVNSSDIRSGASLILAGLIAEGDSVIENISQINRGYENIEEKLKNIGAKIEKA